MGRHGSLLRSLSVGLLAALSCGLATPATAQHNVAVTPSLRLVEPLVMENAAQLDFGAIVARTGGTVTIAAPTGNVTTTGAVQLAGSRRQRATFELEARRGILLLFTGDPAVTLTRVGGTETMRATLDYATGSGLLVIRVLGRPIGFRVTGDVQEIHAGGTLTVPGNQAQGTYEGEFDLTVQYL
jgi:hypothetical protein